mgnify:CR=1 FL=1
MAGYVGNVPVPQSVREDQSFTATAGQTTFNTLGYTDGTRIKVTLNGVLLEGGGVDYTATNGSDIVLTSAAAADDILRFETFNEFTLVGQTLTTPTFTDSATVNSTTTASLSVSGDTTASLTLKNNTHEDTDGGRESTLIFSGEQSGGEISTLAEIEASHDGTSDDQKGDLIFRTNDGSDGTSPTEAIRIDSAQNVGINTTTPSPTALAIQTGGGAKGVLLTRGAAGTNPTNGQGLGSFGFKGSMDGVNTLAAAEASIEAIAAQTHDGSTAATSLAFYTKPSGTGPGSAPTERMRILSSGGLTFNGDTAASNALDDYEEGEWTAGLSVASGSLTIHNNYKTGLYQKIGNTVFISIHVRTSADSSPSGGVTVTGLPFTASSTTKSRFSLGVAPHFGMTGMGGDELLICYITENNSYINILTQNGNNLTSSVAHRFTSSMEMYISGHYRVA